MITTFIYLLYVFIFAGMTIAVGGFKNHSLFVWWCWAKFHLLSHQLPTQCLFIYFIYLFCNANRSLYLFSVGQQHPNTHSANNAEGKDGGWLSVRPAEFGGTWRYPAISVSLVGMNSLEMADVLDFTDNHQYLPPIHRKSLIWLYFTGGAQPGSSHYSGRWGQLESLLSISLLFFSFWKSWILKR